MKTLMTTLIVMMLAASAQAYLITDDNFDGYNAGDIYTDVNPWGWQAWSAGSEPRVWASYNVSTPQCIMGPNQISWNMKNNLTSNVTGADILMSFYVRARNAWNTPLTIQFGESDQSQDRVYFQAGANSSWYYKYKGLGGLYTNILDFNGNPYEVPHGTGERYQQVVMSLVWNGTDYGNTYNVQIFEVDGTAVTPVNVAAILDADSREDGDIDFVGNFSITAGWANHQVWLDDLYIEVIPEPATMSLIGLALLAIRRKK